MKTLMTSVVIAIGAVAFTSLAAGTAQAQKQYGDRRFASQYPSSVAGCPAIAWRLVRDPSGNVRGLAWFTDMSGASQVSGTMGDSGQFSLTLTNTQGNGPVGTVTGTSDPRTGAASARLTGQGCANMAMNLRPLPGGGWGAGG